MTAAELIERVKELDAEGDPLDQLAEYAPKLARMLRATLRHVPPDAPVYRELDRLAAGEDLETARSEDLLPADLIPGRRR